MTRHKVFISYHHDDQDEVDAFIKKFSDECFITRCVGVMDQKIIDSDNKDYIMRSIREKYLTDSTVTIVLLGKCTWARKYVDWEIASTLRNDANNKRSGLMAINLPSVDKKPYPARPARLSANLGEGAYATWYTYPGSAATLRNWIEDAFEARDGRADKIDNSAALFVNNRSCG